MSTNLKAILGVLRHAAIAQRGVLTPSDTKALDALYESHAELAGLLEQHLAWYAGAELGPVEEDLLIGATRKALAKARNL
jgi:hypothetical protein